MSWSLFCFMMTLLPSSFFASCVLCNLLLLPSSSPLSISRAISILLLSQSYTSRGLQMEFDCPHLYHCHVYWSHSYRAFAHCSHAASLLGCFSGISFSIICIFFRLFSSRNHETHKNPEKNEATHFYSVFAQIFTRFYSPVCHPLLLTPLFADKALQSGFSCNSFPPPPHLPPSYSLLRRHRPSLSVFHSSPLRIQPVSTYASKLVGFDK